MSSPEVEHILKAGGHAPAKRVGNMRIKKTRRPSTSKENNRRSSESDEGADEIAMSPPKPIVQTTTQTKGDADFPPEAIRSFHDKPQSHGDFRGQNRGNIIHQPKKV